ncbi:helix-turn-helix domain-containing protein [Sphingorhabdus sp.]|uniref:helix-turn-helix domain-containing protein n=1 Tax=Sphingorhabdus sp. TaxID=1902408 RepID=UPI004047C63B
MNMLTKKQVCEATAMSLSSINRIINSGKMRPVRIGRAVRIPSEELDCFLESLKEARDA